MTTPNDEAKQTEAESEPKTSEVNAEHAAINKRMDFIGGSYLDSAAIPVAGVRLTIKAFSQETVADFNDKKKMKTYPVLQFAEIKMPMLLTAKAHRKGIVKLLGPAAREWVGKKITVYQDTSRRYGSEGHFSMRFKK